MIGKTFFILAISLACCSCEPVLQETRATGTSLPASTDPASMTYRSTWLESGQVTLEQGIHREPAAPGSAAELLVKLTDKQVFGSIEGQEAGAVILVTQAGGTGSFHDLALLGREGSGWVNRDVVLLGDRVDVHDLAIRDNRVVVTMTTQGPQEPMCCPTLRVERRFAVQGGKLVAAGETVLPALPGIVGPVWQWLRTFYNDDSKAVPPKPDAYTVRFGAGGELDVRADCNRKGGRYVQKDKSLAIEVTHSTMAMCPEGSLEERFVRDLAGAAGWFLKDGDLYVDLKYDTGTMRFARQK